MGPRIICNIRLGLSWSRIYFLRFYLFVTFRTKFLEIFHNFSNILEDCSSFLPVYACLKTHVVHYITRTSEGLPDEIKFFTMQPVRLSAYKNCQLPSTKLQQFGQFVNADLEKYLFYGRQLCLTLSLLRCSGYLYLRSQLLYLRQYSKIRKF